VSEDSETDRTERPLDFIREAIRADLAAGRHGGRVATRFPPEPNGHLHIGHAYAASVSYDIAQEFGGTFTLRFDDTNPAAEESEYVAAMQEDLRWLGLDWGERLTFTSSYFEQLYRYACELIRRGKAFVCDLSAEEIAARRGSLREPGRESPYRERSSDESLDLFQRMRAGEFAPGSKVLRARIDMGSSVLPMRDPLLYRIVSAPHHRTGDEWPIYPIYDFAHCLSDAIEGITHSLCSLEFTDRRPLYDWILEQLEVPDPPRQYEFARLNVTHTVMSKRLLKRLVEEGHVEGWDDPRMPTLSGLRRRGYTPEAIRSFTSAAGISKREKTLEFARLEFAIREQQNEVAPRAMGVLRPLKLVVENYPNDRMEMLEAVNNPQDAAAGTRQVPFSQELWIERDDFLEDAPKKFHRLTPGREVRLRYAYLVTCTGVVKNARGEVVEVRCRYDPKTRGGDAPDGRKVRGTIHWVSARHTVPAEVRLYDRLFTAESPREVSEGGDYLAGLNPDSLERVSGAWLEPGLATAAPGARFQLERLGYFCVDPESRPGGLVLNRTATLRDSWAKIARHSA